MIYLILVDNFYFPVLSIMWKGFVQCQWNLWIKHSSELSTFHVIFNNVIMCKGFVRSKWNVWEELWSELSTSHVTFNDVLMCIGFVRCDGNIWRELWSELSTGPWIRPRIRSNPIRNPSEPIGIRRNPTKISDPKDWIGFRNPDSDQISSDGRIRPDSIESSIGRYRIDEHGYLYSIKYFH